MLKKLGALISSVALIAGVLGFASVSAGAAELPPIPTVKVNAPTSPAEENMLVVTGLEATDTSNYRFVIYRGTQALAQIPKAERKLLFAGTLSVEDLAEKWGVELDYKANNLSIKAFYFDKASKYKDRHQTIRLRVGDPLVKAVLLSETGPVKLVDPKKTGKPITDASFELVVAKCVGKKAEDNKMTFSGEWDDNLRFVGTLDGQSISLNKALRNKLWGEEVLTLADLQAAYPGFPVPYGKELKVQMYYFDKDNEYPAFYDTALKLTVGKSDGFIKIGEAKTVTLVDKATLDCDPTIKTAPVVEAKFDLAAAKCVDKKVVDNKMTFSGEWEDNLRFVATLDGQSISLNKALRNKLRGEEVLTLADLQAAYPGFPVPYGKELKVQMYYFDKDNAYPALYDTALKLTVGKSDRFIKIGEPKKVTLVDKATLKCDPPITTPPVVEAKLNLVPAQCVNKVVEDNKLTITGKTMPNLRFVGTVDGKSVLLKTELRDKLLKYGQLTLADLQVAYPKFPIPYGKELQVQMYWFDQERAYADTLYNNPVLAAGNATRFIKLGDPVKITLVDKATVKCQAVKPADETKPNVVVPGPKKPEAKKPEAKKPALPQTGGTAGSSAALAGLALVAGVALVAARRQHS